jgi:hypothetical protein
MDSPPMPVTVEEGGTADIDGHNVVQSTRYSKLKCKEAEREFQAS